MPLVLFKVLVRDLGKLMADRLLTCLHSESTICQSLQVLLSGSLWKTTEWVIYENLNSVHKHLIGGGESK